MSITQRSGMRGACCLGSEDGREVSFCSLDSNVLQAMSGYSLFDHILSVAYDTLSDLISAFVCSEVAQTLLLAVRYQHDLTDHASASQYFVCVPRLADRQPLCDQRLDLLLLEQVE